MTKEYHVGDVLTGTVTGVQPYGAFVSLDENTQGLVHISEITYGFVKDITEFLHVGQQVEVKILVIDEQAQKISLSIRALQERPVNRKKEVTPRKTLQARVDEVDANGFNSLKEKMREWIEQSGY